MVSGFLSRCLGVVDRVVIKQKVYVKFLVGRPELVRDGLACGDETGHRVIGFGVLDDASLGEFQCRIDEFFEAFDVSGGHRAFAVVVRALVAGIGFFCLDKGLLNG